MNTQELSTNAQEHTPYQPATTTELLRILDQQVAEPQHLQLGEMMVRTDIHSLTRTREDEIVPASFNVMPGYTTQYPASVTAAIASLYREYNAAFTPLIDANREWETDYQYAMTPEGIPVNGWVQVDMVGLPEKFLQQAVAANPADLQEVLRGRIFEFENSLAMYQLLQNIFSHDGTQTKFNNEFRASLDALRQQYGKPVALLAVTDQKYQAMKESEFGKQIHESLTDKDIQNLSGFDRFFGPGDFQEYITANGGNCDYLLYVRSSIPKAALRKPGTPFENPLLEHDTMRRIIKAHAVTFNIDNPAWGLGSPRKINDTKAWMPEVGMAHVIRTIDELYSPECRDFLTAHGVDPNLVASGTAVIHAKPMQESYGAYGHHHAEIGNKKLRDDIKTGLQKRGPYVIQPEMTTPVIVNQDTGESYTYIDRNFFTTDGEHFRFMGGFRSLMPLDTQEAKRGRVHGNDSTVWTEIF